MDLLDFNFPFHPKLERAREKPDFPLENSSCRFCFQWESNYDEFLAFDFSYNY